jgi:hypothetical protein
LREKHKSKINNKTKSKSFWRLCKRRSVSERIREKGCVCVYLCVRVCERQRERESGSDLNI